MSNITGLKFFPIEYKNHASTLAIIVTAIFSWHFGSRWNKNNERIVVDEKTGQRFKLKNNHTLFWIPMQYWGVILSTLAIFESFQNSKQLGIICSLIFVTLFVISLINKKSNKTIISKSNFNNEKKIIESKNQVNEEEKQISETEKERIRKEKENPNRFMPK